MEKLNKRRDIHGIIVQLPLDTVTEINTDLILNSIAPEKDVDGYLSTTVPLKGTSEECVVFVMPTRIDDTISGFLLLTVCMASMLES